VLPIEERVTCQRYGAFGRGDIPYIIEELTNDVRWGFHFEP